MSRGAVQAQMETSSMDQQSIKPFESGPAQTPEHGSDQSFESHLRAALSGFEHWHRIGCIGRASVVNRAAHLLREEADGFAQLIALERETLMAQAHEEVMLSADTLDDHAMHTERMLALLSLPGVPGKAWTDHVPMGVLVGVAAPRAVLPLYQLARFCGPTLMAGSAVMVLHAAGSPPPSALAFEWLLRTAGIMQGVYTNLELSGDQVGRLTQDPRVKRVVPLHSSECELFHKAWTAGLW